MERDNRRLYSSMRFEGDGVTKVVALTFELREGDGLSVDFGYGLVESGYIIDYDSQPVLIIFDEPLPKDQTITIRRLTQISEVPHVFQKTGNAQGGSPFNAKNIDENFENITRASQDAMDSQTLASETLEDMSGIRDDALKYRNEAGEFRNEAEVLRDSTIVKADEASISAGKAKTSEVNAKTSETNSKTSETNAGTSASSALASATTATQEATKAGTYASNAKTSETNSKTSETNSKTSETNANSSASKAKTSETNAKTSETNANASATRASASEVNAKTSETNAKHSEKEAQRWAEEAQESALGDILVDGEGDSTTKAMTQKSVTDALNKKWDIQSTTGTGNIARMSEVTNKADTSYVNTELGKKQDVLQDSSGTLEYKSTDVGGALLKATNVSDVTFSLEQYTDGSMSFRSNTLTRTLPAKSGTIALTSDIPALSGYATQSWVNGQGYTTLGTANANSTKLGAEQFLVWVGATDASDSARLATLMKDVPANSVVCRYYVSGIGHARVTRVYYRPVTRS